MFRVYLIGVPEDETQAQALADWLKARGVLSRIETGQFGFPPARPGEVTVMLWSRAAMMSVKRLQMTNRGIDAWENGSLVLVKLEHGLNPTGFGDMNFVDLTFEAARQMHYQRVLDAVRETTAQAQTGADPTQVGGAAPGAPPAPAAPPQSAPSKPAPRKRGLLGGLFKKKSKTTAPSVDKPSVPDTDASEALAMSQDAGTEVFVSYSSQDKAVVWPIVDGVEAEGVSVWIDRDDMRAGEGWAGAIVRAIKTSDTFCLMCSDRAFQSDHVRREVYLADKYKRRLVPVILEPAEMNEDIEYFLADKQWVSLEGVPEAEHCARILKAVREG